MLDYPLATHIAVVASNFSFLLPIYFFSCRINLIINKSFENVDQNKKMRGAKLPRGLAFSRAPMIYACRIYLMQFFVTIMTIFNSVHFHLFEEDYNLRTIDIDSVSLTLCVNFAFLCCDDLYLKNSLDLYFLSMKLIGYFSSKVNMLEMSEIPLMLFIIIAVSRRHIIKLDLKLFCLTFISLLCFFASTFTEFSPSLKTYCIYEVTHSLWHIFIGICYYQALKNILPLNDSTGLLRIEHQYISEHITQRGILLDSNLMKV